MYKFGELFPPPKLDGLQLKRNSFRTHRDYHSRMQLFNSNQYTSVYSSNMKHKQIQRYGYFCHWCSDNNSIHVWEDILKTTNAFGYRLFCWKLKTIKKIIKKLLFTKKLLFICLIALFMGGAGLKKKRPKRGCRRTTQTNSTMQFFFLVYLNIKIKSWNSITQRTSWEQKIL